MNTENSEDCTYGSGSGLSTGCAGEKAGPSMRRSCEACRTSKAKCQPSSDDVRRCQRCLKDSRDCFFAEAKPRPKKARTSKTRVAEMEQKLDGIFALLQSGKMDALIEASSTPVPIETPPEPRVPGPMLNSSIRQSPCPLTSFGTAASNAPVFPSKWKKLNGTEDVIEKGIISFEDADQLLDEYRPYPPHFPFVVILPHVSLESLRRDKPFLLLAILCVSASGDLRLQARLDTELKETLSRKVIMNGERGLDLLQGLLTYLTWYHYFFNPENEQIYQISQMVIAMAVDLGVTQPARRSKVSGEWSKQHGIVHKMYIRQPFQPSPTDLEAQRTFLGCYFVCTNLSTAFRKPSNLKYSDHVGECCRALAEQNEMPGDSLLSYFIRLQRLKEEVSNTFDYEQYQNMPVMEASRIEMLIKSFNKQLAQFQESFPAEAWNNTSISSNFHNLRIYIHEVSLHAPQPPPSDELSGEGSCLSWFHSMARTDALLACLDAAKGYLDRYLKLSLEKVRQNTIVEEIQVIYAMMVLGKFVSGVNSPHLDPVQLRKSANIEHYMEALIARMDALITIIDGEEQRNYFWHFRSLFKYSKLWYLQQIQGEFFTTLHSDGVPDCIDMNVMDVVCLPDYGDTPGSATNSAWSSTENGGLQSMPMAVPMFVPSLWNEKSPTQGDPMAGFFDDYQLPLDSVNMEFDSLGMDSDTMEFMHGV